jgi:hypothetical protein
MNGVSISSVEAAFAEMTGFVGIGCGAVGSGVGGKTTAGFAMGAGAGSTLTGSVSFAPEEVTPAGLKAGNGGGTEERSTAGLGGGNIILVGIGADLLAIGAGMFAIGVGASGVYFGSLAGEEIGGVVFAGAVAVCGESEACRFSM